MRSLRWLFVLAVSVVALALLAQIASDDACRTDVRCEVAR